MIFDRIFYPYYIEASPRWYVSRFDMDCLTDDAHVFLKDSFENRSWKLDILERELYGIRFKREIDAMAFRLKFGV